MMSIFIWFPPGRNESPVLIPNSNFHIPHSAFIMRLRSPARGPELPDCLI
jgi:hypothetical protein